MREDSEPQLSLQRALIGLTVSLLLVEHRSALAIGAMWSLHG